MANTGPVSLSGVAGAARTFQVQYQAEINDAASYRSGALILALRGLADACDALQTAKAQAATIMADPRLAQNVKTQEARDVVKQAIAAAQAAEQTYTDALESITTAIRAAMVPKPPSGSDAGLLAFRAQETVKLLEATAQPSRISAASKRLADALATGDAAMAYILAGGALLTDTYQRLGMNAETLQGAFAGVISQAQSTTMIPGAKLLTLLSKGGSGTLRGLSAVARTVFYNEQQQAAASLASYVAIGAAQAGPIAPGGSPR